MSTMSKRANLIIALGLWTLLGIMIYYAIAIIDKKEFNYCNNIFSKSETATDSIQILKVNSNCLRFL